MGIMKKTDCPRIRSYSQSTASTWGYCLSSVCNVLITWEHDCYERVIIELYPEGGRIQEGSKIMKSSVCWTGRIWVMKVDSLPSKNGLSQSKRQTRCCINRSNLCRVIVELMAFAHVLWALDVLKSKKRNNVRFLLKVCCWRPTVSIKTQSIKLAWKPCLFRVWKPVETCVATSKRSSHNPWTIEHSR